MDTIELKRELANAIALQCLKMNTIGDKKNSIVGEPCVFFYIAGHVGTIDIGVYEKGWESGCRPDRAILLDKHSTLAEFKDCLTYLRELHLSRIMKEEGKELCVELDQAVGA
ncbi:hypothetical protein [Acetobacterium woodii]|uniref:Uncharacterized protein n=1 Tax=Acetobacterium woodii (strain ATCC 29683 / DSM 1030 / JCM 2381 / KCTC 1655 / WB1) TaxID=931626 RepID=H6LIW1_ACEWD|nr:hypothetical protein [Acetobacterium woodii]AFA49850.1 hypothetical protein Awo_c31220 [Acetobacterium woodii DSM 1030]